MNVRLISHTIACADEGMENIVDLQDLIGFCARVSNPSNQMNTETTERLINYLIKHKHWSPFEMADVTLEVETTRDIAHQIVRHRSYAFQEFSQRYANPVQDLKFEIREARLQDTKNRQNSIETNDPVLQQMWTAQQQRIIDEAVAAYNWAIQNGIAKEVARAVLPEGLTSTRLYMKGSIRSWIHYIEVRTDPTTQKEHREVADACAREIAKVFPLINKFSQHGESDAK